MISQNVPFKPITTTNITDTSERRGNGFCPRRTYCITCGCGNEFDSVGDRICFCDSCHLRGCQPLIGRTGRSQYTGDKTIPDEGCIECGCSRMFDDSGDRICFCDSCQRRGCQPSVVGEYKGDEPSVVGQSKGGEGCMRCGCTREVDESGDRVCFCDSCSRGGCHPDVDVGNEGCMRCGCSKPYDESGDRICFCDSCSGRGCQARNPIGCFQCGCSREFDLSGEKICFCDPCRDDGCRYTGKVHDVNHTPRIYRYTFLNELECQRRRDERARSEAPSPIFPWLNSPAPPPLTAERLMEELQFREIVPEDYELLVVLHERVNKRETVAAHALVNLGEEEVVVGNVDAHGGISQFCVICQEKYVEGSTIRRLQCSHTFHKECIDEWLTTGAAECPIDRTPVSQGDT